MSSGEEDNEEGMDLDLDDGIQQEEDDEEEKKAD